ncbi:MAG: nucleotidyltransferase family protein [Clostridia bacterium]|nr:nucleotidyltransferase family protein [Clostridia bacterium]
MTKNFLDTIYLYNCAIRGKEPEIKSDINIKDVYIISKKQGIWDTVFLSLKKLYDKDKTIIEADIFNKLNNEFLIKCTLNSKRLVFVHNIIKKLEDNGINCCILKGESVSLYYNTPLARISSDTDILIDKEETDRCLEILKEEGFIIEEQLYESHQIRCEHPTSGLIEIHNRMYGVKTEDVTFNNEIKYDEDHVTFLGFDKCELKTLGYTDNALFLLMHFLKHFISEGVGVRQLADTLLYIENNFSKIDFDRVNTHLKNLKFDTVFSYIIEIGKRYFDFPKDLVDTSLIDEKLLEKILFDMECGGVFGKDSDRKGFYDLYLAERYKSIKNKDISEYYNKRKLARLFPNRKFMSINYPYVEKNILLMPIAWVHRMIDSIKPKKEILAGENNNERLDFFKELDMI